MGRSGVPAERSAPPFASSGLRAYPRRTPARAIAYPRRVVRWWSACSGHSGTRTAVAEALFWGVLASSSLLVGGVIALRVRIPTGVLGLTMAFGAGVLISAVAYELVEEAFETAAGSGAVAVGLALGSLAFFVGDLVIDRMGGADRKRSQASQAGRGTALATFSPGPRYRCCSATSLPLSMAAARSARQRRAR